MIGRLVDEFTPGDFADEWDLEGLWVQLDQIYHVDFGSDEVDRSAIDREELKRMLSEDALTLYDEREAELGDELMRALERYLILQIIDQRWREHLYDMDYLREGIHLRGFAQIEPLVAYKNEAFTLLRGPDELDLGRLRADGLQRRGRGAGHQRRRRAGRRAAVGAAPAPHAGGLGALAYSGGTEPNAYGAPGEPAVADSPVVQQRRVDETRSWAATTPAGAGRARSSRSATAPDALLRLGSVATRAEAESGSRSRAAEACAGWPRECNDSWRSARRGPAVQSSLGAA